VCVCVVFVYFVFVSGVVGGCDLFVFVCVFVMSLCGCSVCV